MDRVHVEQSETQPLLLEHEDSCPGRHGHTKKPRCWACWEETGTESNPLIRVCLGCKDIDLQFIHQDCINSYLNNLRDDDPDIQPSQDDKEKPRPSFRCTRCQHPYRVEFTDVHPLVTLWHDVFLRYAMIIMTVCLIVSTVCCSMLLWERGFDLDAVIPIQSLDINVPVVLFAASIMIFCHSINIITWRVVWSYCSGRTRKFVRPAIESY